MRIPDDADRFMQPGEQIAARAGRGESIVCFKQQFDAPASLLSFLLPPCDRLGRLLVVFFGQCLSPGTAAKSADVSRAPRIGPAAKRQELGTGLDIVADKFEGRI